MWHTAVIDESVHHIWRSRFVYSWVLTRSRSMSLNESSIVFVCFGRIIKQNWFKKFTFEIIDYCKCRSNGYVAPWDQGKSVQSKGCSHLRGLFIMYNIHMGPGNYVHIGGCSHPSEVFSLCKRYKKDREIVFNPFTLRAAKTRQTILDIFFYQKHFLENIWRRNVAQKSNNNSHSNILWTFALFLNYFQKYESSRRHFLEELWVWMG